MRIPIYEYRCDRCGAEFEKLLRRTSEEVDCPGCASPAVTRVPSAFAFKGGERFVSSGKSGCSGCQPGPGGCSGCGH